MLRFVDRVATKFQQHKKYDKNNSTKNWQNTKQYDKYDKTFVYSRVMGNFKDTQPTFIFCQMTKITPTSFSKFVTYEKLNRIPFIIW